MGAENEKGEEAAFQKTIKPLEAPISILIRAFFWEACFRVVYLTRQTGRKGKHLVGSGGLYGISILIFFGVSASFGCTCARLLAFLFKM